MPDFDSSGFTRSVAGQLLRKIGERGASGADPHELSMTPQEQSALRDLERQGYVKLARGAGAMAWKVERVEITPEGAARLEKG